MATLRFFLIALSTLALGGCGTTKVNAMDNGQAEVDQQIVQSAQKIQSMQAELYQAGAINQEAAKQPVNILEDRQRITISWQGDAVQLLTKLARDRGIGLSVMGLRMPLPVNIDVKEAPYDVVMQMLRAQVGYRADISEQADKLVLHYGRPQP